jgi:iron(II)-dependent oxidoreductase
MLNSCFLLTDRTLNIFTQPSSLETARQTIRQDLEQCRGLTLDLFGKIDRNTLCQQAHADFSPLGWHLGHIAFVESFWIREHCAGLPPLLPEYHQLWLADGLPKDQRQNLPSTDVIYDYLNQVREDVLTYLDTAPLEKEATLWHWLVQHESQHNEIICFILSLHDRNQNNPQHSQKAEKPNNLAIGFEWIPAKTGMTEGIEADGRPQKSDMVEIPAGEFEMGSDEVNVLDCERQAHRVFLDTYWIDRSPVTCGEYRQFMAAGGYENREYWSDAGWQWLQTDRVEDSRISKPLYWHDGEEWDDRPVSGVTWYEADAYARFVGKRLPTEAEWEKAATWDAKIGQIGQKRLYPWGNEKPSAKTCNHNNLIGHTTSVNAYPNGQSAYGCLEMLGNIWEWTDSWFEGYPGFKFFPYQGFSQDFFDGQHRVLRGGSWATRPWALRGSIRNWYNPWIRQILAGFRCAK